MANKNTIAIELIVNDKGSVTIKNFGNATETAMREAGASTNNYGSSLQNLSASAKSSFTTLQNSWMALTAVTAGAVAAAKNAIAAFVEEEAAQMKLAVAMRNQGDFTRDSFSALLDYAAQLQKTTTFGDELTIAVMANLKTYGMETEELKKATKAAMDLAVAKGMDLMTASELVGKAFVGETGTLTRYGIVIDEGLSKTQKFDAVLGQIQQRFGGSAQAEIETYAGQWKQIANWWGDLAEVAGLALLKTLEAIQFAVGLLAVGFYGALEGIIAGFRMLVEQAEKLPLIGEKFSGFAEHLRTIEGGYEQAKEGALKFTDTNYQMLTSFTKVQDAAEKMGNGVKAAIQPDPAIEAARKKAVEDIVKAIEAANIQIETIGKSQYDQDIIRINAKVEEYRKAGVGEVLIAQYVAIEKEVAAQKAALVAEAAEKKLEEERKKLAKEAGDRAVAQYNQIAEAEEMALAAKQQTAIEYAKLVSGEAEFAATENERAINKIIADHAEKVRKLNELQESGNLKYKEYMFLLEKYNANKNAAIVAKEIDANNKIAAAKYDMVRDIKGMEGEAYRLRLIQIEAEKQKRIKDAGDTAEAVILAEKWAAEEIKKAYLVKLKESDDWKDGVLAGLIEITNKQTTWATTSTDLVKGFATDASSAFGKNFKDVLKGDFDDLGDAWKGVWDNMLTTLGQRIGDMIIEAAAREVVLQFSASLTGTGLAIINAILGYFGYNPLSSNPSSGTQISGSMTGTGGISGGPATSGGYSGGSFAAFAEGGVMPAGSPVWVGERGPELLFPMSAGYVMNHNDSMAYAAKNGGHIPGLASGGVIANDELYNLFVSHGWIYGGNDGTTLIDPTGNAKVPASYMTQWGSVHPQLGPQYEAPDGRWLNTLFLSPGSDYISHSGGWLSMMPWWANLIDTGLSILSPAWGVVSGASKAVVGGMDLLLGSNDKNSAYAMIGIGALQGYGSWGNLGSGVGGAASGYSAGTAAYQALVNTGIKQGIGFVLNTLFGSGDLSFGFDGINDNGLGDALRSSISGIAPKSDNFAFHLKNGLDYVPYDGFPARLHKGERVETAEEADQSRREKKAGRGDIILQFHYHGTVVDSKRAAREMAEMVYPELHKLKYQWGH